MGKHSGDNSFGASNKIDLRHLPSTFKPGENPLKFRQPARAKLLWRAIDSPAGRVDEAQRQNFPSGPMMARSA